MNVKASDGSGRAFKALQAQLTHRGDGFEIGIETNGTLLPPPGIDWICVSPKAGAPWVQRSGHELKLVWPQSGFSLADMQAMQSLPFSHHRLQPLDDVLQKRNTQICIELCLQPPVWKLSMQTHKVSGIR